MKNVQRRSRVAVDSAAAQNGGGKLARRTLEGRFKVQWRPEMRAIVTCECCGSRHAVARSIRLPESFHLVCHYCEGVLRVDVTAADLKAAEAKARPLWPAARV